MNDVTTSCRNDLNTKPNILILSAYDAESHKRWHKGLVRTFTEYHFEVLALPARYFSWRIRGNALTWALAHREILLSREWSAIVATSMVDLATLKGLVPELAKVKSLLYFHENQFAYPLNLTPKSTTSAGRGDNYTIKQQPVEPQMVSLYSALVADQIVFNSDYNYQTFLDGLDALLKKLPDHVPAGIPLLIKAKATVLPVPLEESCFALASCRMHRPDINQTCKHNALTVVWNHRWEYDKGPEFLLAMLQHLIAITPKKLMKWHIVGQRFRKVPSAFEAIKQILIDQDWLGSWGYLPLEQYQKVLVESDIVLSTAQHEFQGLAVMEAVAAGCIPVLPDNLAYPNFFDAQYLYRYGNVQDACDLLLNANLFNEAPYFKRAPSWANLRHGYHSILKRLMPS